MKDREEIWKDIPRYEGLYQISNVGGVRVLNRSVNHNGTLAIRKGKRKANANDQDGYHLTQLSKNGIKRMFRVHRLVAMAFVPNPENKPQVNHKNGIKDDNRAENLEWVTSGENTRHAIKMGLAIPGFTRNPIFQKGSDCPSSILNEEQVRRIKLLLAIKTPQKGIAEIFNVNKRTISAIKTGVSWKHVV